MTPPSYRRRTDPARIVRLRPVPKADPVAASLREIASALRANAERPPGEIHLHVDPGAIVVHPPTVEVHPHIDATTHIADGAVRVDNEFTVEAPKPVDVQIVRDAANRVAGLKVQ